MTFFDLNIPYTESPKQQNSTTTNKQTRLKLTIKAIQLGYTGVAYNRTITRTMSEQDRCSITLFPLSSVLKLSPSISNAVNFHRTVMNIATATPFRQYTRLTVVVDTPAQGSCLNAGNPVIKSYDIVAVRPLKQEVFDLACKSYEVDIIAIDFSENRFRLKQPLIKAAIERGVYFEITYSGLLVDAQLRRQMISNAKLLVDWTRGKNVIFSSAAASVTEFRGPYDAANLAACLLGFSMERAKACVSKTCRSLLENSLRKKKFYKEAIKVELISSTEDGFDDWLKWDPISSGEGDLQLDDMAKSFAASNKESKTVKAIDFVSVINELPSHGLQINDIVTETRLDSKLHDPHKKDDLLKSGNCDVSQANENLETLASVEADETCAMIVDEPEQQNLSLEVHEDTHEEHVVDEKEGENMCSDVPNPEILIPVHDNPSSNLQCEEGNNLSPNATLFPPMTASNEAGSLEEVLEEHMSDIKDVAVTPVNSCLASSVASLNEDLLEEHMSDTKNIVATPASSSGASLDQDILEVHTGAIGGNVSTVPSSALATLRTHDELQINGCDSVVHEPLEDVSMDVNVGVKDVHEPLENVSMDVNVWVKDDSHMNHFSAHESSSGGVRRKHGSSRQSISFPFRRWLKPLHCKRSLKVRRKSTIL